MTTRLLGETGSRKRHRFLVLPILLAAALALLYVAGAQAVHDTGRFQLDGDASSATQPPPPYPQAVDDWDKVCHQVIGSDCSTTQDTTGATAVTFTGDCPVGQSGLGCNNNNATIFTGGGSKDPQDMSNWSWKDGAGGLPDKDNLVHAFAVRYSLNPDPATCPSGGSPTCDVIYFGSDRFDNSGDAQQGFWFLQNPTSLVSGKSNSFSGVHKTGDILVISDFSNGGTTSTITVYTWDPTCTATNKPFSYCGDANLHLQETSDNAKCSSALATPDAFCGIVNPTDGTFVPWNQDYTDKSGNHTYLNGEFYEAGINLSTIGLAGECFSSVVSETRSSTSTTATLKDFVLGSFAQCKAGMTTHASNNGTVLPGTAVHDTATITVGGGTSPPDPTGTVTFFLCGPNATGAPDCSAGGTNIGTGTLGDAGEPTPTPNDGMSHADSPDVNTSTAKLTPGYYCFRAEWPGDTNYPTPLKFTNQTDECFRVKDTSTTTTAQDWLPNDSATVKLSDGTTAGSGTVTFSLYENGTCTEPAKTTFGPITLVNGQARTNNTSTYVSPGTTISWRVTFTPSDPNAVDGSTSGCERSDLTINDNAGP